MRCINLIRCINVVWLDRGDLHDSNRTFQTSPFAIAKIKLPQTNKRFIITERFYLFTL